MSKCSGPRPLSRPASPASPEPYLIVLTVLRANGPLVTFLRSGLTVPWDSRFGSLLELAEACAVPVRWSCRSGVCHNCESGLIEGELAYAPEPLDPPAEGNALICCAMPQTAVELDL
jgi:ferredoxin